MKSLATFTDWARESLIPLSSIVPRDDELARIGEMIGAARVVALGEAMHFAAQPLEFRNRLFRYLVEEKGFTAIALESGLTESRAVHDYVLGGAGDLTSVVAEGISWTFDRLPQNLALVRWLKELNDHRSDGARKVKFYGFDVPGSPGDGRANRGADTALLAVLAYLDEVDADAGAVFRGRLQPFLQNIVAGPSLGHESCGYQMLGASARDAVTATIADLVALMERRESRYTSATSRDDYEWAFRATLGAQQVDRRLRRIPRNWCASEDQIIEFLDEVPDLRDRAQADNLEWIIDREGPSGKVLVFGHNNHLSCVPVEWRYRRFDAPSHVPDLSRITEHYVAGTYLRRRFENDLFVIGNLVGGGKTGCGEPPRSLQSPPLSTLDGIAGDAGFPRFILDLRTMPPESRRSLAEARPLAHGFDYLGKLRVSMHLALVAAYDAVFYVAEVSPALAEGPPE